METRTQGQSNRRFAKSHALHPRRTGEKIFHLPFDQQYDSVLIEEERLERYVETVAEAESLGFRHAYRWKAYLADQP